MTKETLRGHFEKVDSLKAELEKAKVNAFSALEEYVRSQPEPVFTSDLVEITHCPAPAIYNYFKTNSTKIYQTDIPVTTRYIKLDENNNPIPGAIKKIQRFRSAYSSYTNDQKR